MTKRWLAIAMLFSGCGGGGAASAPTVTAISVGGQYDTVVTLQESSCAGITVMSLPTTVTHSAGAARLALTHAGTTYPGALQADGRFATDPQLVGGSTVRIEGRFTTTGLDASVTVDVQGSAPCRYVTRWAGTKQGPPNVLP